MKTHGTHRAFTLIELLTVIAIIGILASILIPVVGRVRESARTANCVSNLRQLGTGMVAAIGDNNDRFIDIPRNQDTGDGNWPLGQAIVGLVVALDPYLEEGIRDGDFPGNPTAYHAVGVWRCPTVEAQGRFVQWPYYPSGWMWTGGDSQNLYVGRPVYAVPEPTRFPMIADRGCSEVPVPSTGGSWGSWSPGATGSGGFSPERGWHGGNRLNVAFGDGSVRGYSYVPGETSEFADILEEAQPSNWP